MPNPAALAALLQRFQAMMGIQQKMGPVAEKPTPSVTSKSNLAGFQDYMGEIAVRSGRAVTNAQDVMRKEVTPGMMPDDEAFLRQYISPKTDIFPKQHRRPTSLPKSQQPKDVEWRRLNWDPEEVSFGMTKDDFAKFMRTGEPTPLSEEFLDLGRKGGLNLGGLGSHKVSLGKDKEGMYVSIYDVLDYESQNVNPVISALLKNAGKPFAVYDRFYLDPASLALIDKRRTLVDGPDGKPKEAAEDDPRNFLVFSGKVTHR
jgi:hypothetical protein